MKQLEKHLSILQHNDNIAIWHDRRILPGQAWESEIDEHLNSSKLILFLVSPDFLASEYCYSIELNRALEMHREGLTQVIPIIIRPVLWRLSPLASFQALPKDGKPITLWENTDAAYLDVAEGLLDASLNFDKLKVKNINLRDSKHISVSSNELPFQSSVSFIVTLNHDINQLTEENRNRILEKLREVTSGSDIKLVEIKQGSVVFVLKSDERSFNKITTLSKSGELSRIIGFNVSSVSLLSDLEKRFSTAFKRIVAGLNFPKDTLEVISKCEFDDSSLCSLPINLLHLLAELVRLSEAISEDINIIWSINRIQHILGTISVAFFQSDVEKHGFDKKIFRHFIFDLYQSIEGLQYIFNTFDRAFHSDKVSPIDRFKDYVESKCQNISKTQKAQLLKGLEMLFQIRNKIAHFDRNLDGHLLDEEFKYDILHIKKSLDELSAILEQRVNRLFETPFIIKNSIAHANKMSLSDLINDVIPRLPHNSLPAYGVWSLNELK